MMKTKQLATILGVGLASAGAPLVQAGTFSANFDSGATPAGATLFNGNPDGTAGVIETTGGVGGSGVLKLTKAVNGVTGSMIIGDLDAGAKVNAFTATFNLRIGGGSSTPADGMSFCFADNLPDGTFGEEGAGSGLRIGVDIYNNGGEAPSLNIFWNGARVATTGVIPISNITTGSAFVPVLVRINPTGTLDLTYNNVPVFTDRAIGFTPIAAGRFGFGARTGGLNTNQFVDDLVINTTVGDYLTPSVLTAPRSQTIVSGYPARLAVKVNDPANATYQWEKKTPADGSFSPIVGATDPTLTTATLAVADSGTQYRVVVSNPGAVTATSAVSTLTVINLPHVTPDTAAFNFDDGLTPAGSNNYGSAAPIASGGFGDSGFMELTPASNGLAGTWTVDDLNGGLPVESIDIAFKLNLTPNPGQTPADGFGFHWAPDLPASGFPNAEEPVGSGLSIGFDVYDNGGGEAPALDVFWLGTRIGGVKLTADILNTNGAFADVQIRLSAAGKIDVAFNGEVIANQLTIPSWTAFSGAKYGFAARTGGLNQEQAIDNVQIRSVPYSGPIGFVTAPSNVLALVGRTASFSAVTNDPTRSQYQWQKSSSGGAFTNIPGATDPSYTTPVLTNADNGNQYRVHITSTGNGTQADSPPATLTVYDLAAPATAQIIDQFNNGTDADNVGTVPGAVQTFSGNYTFADLAGNGYLVMTTASNSQFGTLVIDDFNGGSPVGGFTASVKAQLVGDNPADGWSFSWGRDISPAQAYGGLEAGLGSDLRVSFITYGGSGRSIRVNWRGTQIANVPVDLGLLQSAPDTFEEVLFRVKPATAGSDALLDVAQDGRLVINSLPLPGLLGVAGGRFAVAARTGGANELHAYDDLRINTVPYVGPITVASQSLTALTLVKNTTTTLAVESSNPPITTYQWQRSAPGGAPFVNVGGATDPTYTPAALPVSENGVSYRCVLTSTGNVVQSVPVVLTVVDPALPTSWERVINFDDGLVPSGGAVFGSANVVSNGGLLDSGMLQLTTANNGLQGSFGISDQDFGNPVSGFVSQFYVRIGNGTDPPADGASFVWSPQPIASSFGEGGTGDGLVVSFDIYDNDDGNPNNAAGEAPAIEVIYKGDSLGNIRVPRSLMESNGDFREVIVRVNPSGTLDVIYGNQVIFWHAPLPNYTPFSGASFGWGGRTGGLNAEQDIESISLTTTTNEPWLNVSQDDINLTINFDGVLETSTNLSTWVPQPAQATPLILPLSGMSGHQYFRSRK